MKRIVKFSLFVMFTVVCLSGCVVVDFSDFNAVTGKGDLESYEFRVGSYSGIRIDGLCNIQYYADSSDTVTLEVQPNLREYFVVEVKDGDLVVRTTRRMNFDTGKAPVLTVFTPVLNRLTIGGLSTFTANDKISADSFTLKLNGAGDGKAELDVNSFFADLSGAGSFDLSGRAETVDLKISGAGELDAISLQTQDAKLNLSGTGKIRISCARTLRIIADGLGSIEYIGSPSIDQNTSGLVSIKKIN